MGRYQNIPSPETPRKIIEISRLLWRQIVTAPGRFVPFFPHPLPAFAAVALGLAGFAAVGLPTFRKERQAAYGAGPGCRGYFPAQGGLQHRVSG